MDDAGNETGAAIAVVPVEGGELTYLTPFERYASAPDWSWATDEIVYSIELIGLKPTLEPDEETWNLFGIRPDGSAGRQITNLGDGERLHAPRWAPDGQAVIAKQFDHDAGGGRLVDAATGDVEPFRTGLDEARPLVRPFLSSQ